MSPRASGRSRRVAARERASEVLRLVSGEDDDFQASRAGYSSVSWNISTDGRLHIHAIRQDGRCTSEIYEYELKLVRSEVKQL